MINTTKKIKNSYYRTNWKQFTRLCMGVGLMVSTSASAFNSVFDNLALTDLQHATGDVVQQACVRLIGANAMQALQGDQKDLLTQCSAMVSNARTIDSSDPNAKEDTAKLGSALQNVATEEMGTPSRVSMSTLSGQVAEINTHLFDIHKLSQAVGGSSGDDGSLLANRFSVFVNGMGGFGDMKSSDRENATDFSSGGIVIGLDYRFTDHFVSGMAFGYSHLDSDFQQSVNVSGGGVDADIYNLSIFASYDIANFYVDGTFTYGWSDYDIERGVVISESISSNVDRVATADADGEQYAAGFGFGYNYNLKAFNINPYFRLDYYHGKIDDYTESGAEGLNLSVDEQNFESLQTLLGVQLAYAFSHSYGVFIPQFNVGWYHEILNNSRAINARYTAADILSSNPTLTALTDNPDRDYATVGFGFSNVFQGGVQVFFNYQALLGYRNINSNGFTGGVRYEF